MMNSKKQREENGNSKIRLFFTGLTMGLADLVPGVSGGTIAFLFGIYDELLYTVKLLTGHVPQLFLKGKFKEAFRLIPFSFLLPFAAGISVAILGLVQIVDHLLEAQPVMVWAFFFGLVLGSSYIIARRVTEWTLRRALLLVAGLTLTYVLVGLPSLSGNSSPLAVFATGFIAIVAMILPGISGSLIMVLLGQYETIINAVAERDIVTMSFFAAGAVCGLAAFVRLLTWLLKHYHLAVIATLVGVMVGSLRRIWPWQVAEPSGVTANFMPQAELATLWAVLLMVVGFALVFLLEQIGLAQEHDDIHTREFKKELKDIEG